MAHHVARKRQYLSFGSFVVTTLASGAAAALSPPSNPSSAVSPTAPQAPARVAALPHRAGGAQTAGDEPAGTNGSSSKWGFGVSVTYPIASIYMAQLSYSAWSMGDVLTGYAYQDWRDDQGQSHAQTLLLGYRQFIWRGLHTEVELWPAYNPFTSSIDGKSYKGLELWLSARVGYRLDFEVYGRELFILAQPSVGFGVARQNKWPKMQRGFNPIFEPQLIVGTRF